MNWTMGMGVLYIFKILGSVFYSRPQLLDLFQLSDFDVIIETYYVRKC